MDCKEGRVEGYVKPLFRNLKVLSLKNDLKEDDVFHLFWEAIVGTATEILKNQKRDQFGTVIPFKGDLTNPRTGLLSGVGNVLYNAFVRAYLPKLQGTAEKIEGMEFAPDRSPTRFRRVNNEGISHESSAIDRRDDVARRGMRQ
jgi:hypothetical protein